MVVSAELWDEKNPPSKPMSQWLMENMPKGTGVKEPEYDEGGRYIAFSDVIFADDE